MNERQIAALSVLLELQDRMSPALDAVAANAQATGERMRAIVSGIATAWNNLGGTEKIKELAQTASDLADLSNQTGITAEALQRLGFAAEQNGGSLQQIARAASILGKNLAGGSDSTKAALEALGLSFDALREMSPEQALYTISEALAPMEDKFAQTAAATTLFGRSGIDLLPTLTANLRETGEAAVVMSTQTVQSLDDAGDRLDAAKANLEASLGTILGTVVNAVGADTAAIGAMFGSLLTTLAPLTPALVALWPTLVTVGTYIGGALVTAVGAVLSPIGLVVAAVVGLGLVWYNWGEDIKRFVSEAYTAVKTWLWDKFEPIVTAVSGFLSTMKGYWDGFKSGVVTVVTETATSTKSFLVDRFEDVKSGVQNGLSAVKGFWDAHNAAVGAVLGLIVGKVSAFVGDLTDWLGPKIRAVFEATKAIINLILDYHVAMIQAVIAKVTDFLASLRDFFGAKLRAIVTAVKAIIDPIVTYFTSVKDRAVAIAQQLYTGVYNWLVTQFQNIVAGIKAKIDSVTGFFSDMYQKVVGGSIVPDMVNEIGDWFGPRLQAAMVDPAGTATDDVVTSFNSMGERVNFQDFIDKWGIALDEVKTKTGTFKEEIGAVWDEIREAIGSRIQTMTSKWADALRGMLDGSLDFKEGLKQIWDAILDALLNAMTGIVNGWINRLLGFLGWAGGQGGNRGGSGPSTPPITIPIPPIPGGGSGDRMVAQFDVMASAAQSAAMASDRLVQDFDRIMTASSSRTSSADMGLFAFRSAGFGTSGSPFSASSLAQGDNTRTVRLLESIHRELTNHQPDIVIVPMVTGDADAFENRMAETMPRRVTRSANLRNAWQRAVNGTA